MQLKFTDMLRNLCWSYINVFFIFYFLTCIYSKSSGSAAFISLAWTCLLVHKVFSAPEKREGPIWKKMVSERTFCACFKTQIKRL